VLAALEHYRPKRVLISLDADHTTNPNVALGLVKGYRSLTQHGREHGYEIAIERWELTERTKGIDDLLRSGGVPDLLEGDTAKTYVDDLRRQFEAKAAATHANVASGRPRIYLDVDEHRVTDRVIEAIAADPDLYVRGVWLARVDRTLPRRGDKVGRPAGTPQIRLLPTPSVREKITRYAELIRVTTNPKGEQTEKPAHPPDWLVPQVMSRGNWPCLRTLEGVIECPTLRPDGSILDRQGYDEATGLFYQPNLEYPPIPQEPTRDHAVQAADRLLDLVCDFPFIGPAHKAVWLSAVMTMIARPAIDGCCPLFVFDASAARSGKTKLANLVSILATGRDAPVTPCPQEDDEMRKLITAVVLAGDKILLLDNLDQSRRLGGAALDAALTATIWTERILGKSEKSPPLPIHTVFMATGNNVGLRGDTHGRVLPCRIEPQCEKPEERDDFKHADLISYAKEHRAGYVRDALIILRAYFVAGRPVSKLPAWGSYEAWSGTIRQAIHWATTFDPNETRQEIRTEDASSEQLAALFAAWGTLPEPERLRSVAELISEVRPPRHFSGGAEEHPLWRLFLTWSKDGKAPDAQSVGIRLARYRGRYQGSRFLHREEQKGERRGVAQWAIR
jgi:putative DNA primase/helicase